MRGRGLMCAFSLPDQGLRDAVLAAVRDDERVLLLGCGTRSVRFRPALTVSVEDLSDGVAALDRVLTRLRRGLPHDPHRLPRRPARRWSAPPAW